MSDLATAPAIVGPLSKRASKVIGNAALFNLVQDMAATLDTRLPAIEAKLDDILLILGRPKKDLIIES